MVVISGVPFDSIIDRLTEGFPFSFKCIGFFLHLGHHVRTALDHANGFDVQQLEQEVVSCTFFFIGSF